jgi:NhaP-type Na+/H+ or K+/H+ antiporter
LAETFTGNGFIAAFCAGLLAGNTSVKTREHIEDFAESEGELLVLISFFLFGVAFVPAVIEYVTFKVVIYALLSLTVLRMLPVMICLIGAKIDSTNKLDIVTASFIAWFGPRGIASILYVLIVVRELDGMAGFDTLYATVMVTVLLSTVSVRNHWLIVIVNIPWLNLGRIGRNGLFRSWVIALCNLGCIQTRPLCRSLVNFYKVSRGVFRTVYRRSSHRHCW